MAPRPAHVPEHLVVDFDAFGKESIAELMVKVEEWRRLGPVVWTDHNNGHWVVMSSTILREVLSDPLKFSSSKPGQGVTLTQVDRPLQVPIEMDGTEHRQYRRILMPLFSPQRVTLLEESVRASAKSLLAGIVSSGSCDVVGDFARPLTSTMFLRLMDWPLEDHEELENLADLGLNGPPHATPEERGAAKLDAHRKIAEYVSKQLALRCASNADATDMTTIIMNSTLAGGEPIPEDKLVAMLRLLLFAGLDTTQSVLSQTLTYLGTHPEAQSYLREHRDEIPRMVEEFLRWTGAAMPSRTATMDVEVGGVHIAAGDTVHALIAAANRDSEEFEHPEVVDFTRSLKGHAAFSIGPHKCIGSPLARVVLATALEEFHTAIDSYRVEASESHIGAVWGMNHVDLALVPAGAAAAG